MESEGGRIRVLVFASGDEKGGGSGFQELVEFSRTNPPVLDAQIVGVISNYPTWRRLTKSGCASYSFRALVRAF